MWLGLIRLGEEISIRDAEKLNKRFVVKHHRIKHFIVVEDSIVFDKVGAIDQNCTKPFYMLTNPNDLDFVETMISSQGREFVQRIYQQYKQTKIKSKECDNTFM